MKTVSKVLLQAVALLLVWLPGSAAVLAQTDALEWDEPAETWPHFLDPQKVAVLGMEVDGLVAQIHCQPQDFVGKGDVLLPEHLHFESDPELFVWDTEDEEDGFAA